MNSQEIKKRKLLYEVEEELWGLIKRRAWAAVGLFALVGAGGIWATVHYAVQQVAETPLRELQKQLVD